jgi:hypothetical protein
VDPAGEWTGLSLFPNPARGEFKLRTDAPIGHGLTVTLRDVYGRELFSKAFTHLAHETVFNVEDIAAGTYMVEVTAKRGQRKAFKLVLQ